MELDKNLVVDKKAKQELVIKKQEQQVEQFLGKARSIKGLIWYSYNLKTKELKKASILEGSKVYDIHRHQETQSKRIHIEKYCVYLQALNVKNAKRHIFKKFGTYPDIISE